jgi:hypothetical protein
MTYASLNGIGIVRGSVVVPSWGIWHADLWLESGETLSGSVSLQLADLTAKATVIRGVSTLGQAGYRVVGGAGGWRQAIGSWQYANAAGLTLSTVLQHTAAPIGETVNVPADVAIGTAFVRQAGRASLVLQQLIPGGWYVGFDGITYAAPRTPSVVAGAWSLISVAQPSTAYVVATESVAEWLPGAAFAGPSVSGTVNRVRHVITAGTLRTEVMADG